MDHSLPLLFVVPTGNTLPTTGSTDALTDGQFGIFQDEALTATTAATAPNASFIRFAQGQSSLGLPSKKSDKIALNRIMKFYKTTAKASQVEIWDVGNFNVPVTDSVSLTLIGHSTYLDGLYQNGFRQTYTIPAGCLECGDDPCATVSNSDVIDAFIAKYNADVDNAPNAANIPAYFTFTKVGTGDTAVLRITGKALTISGAACDLASNPFSYDRMWFQPVAFLGPDTTADHEVDENCPVVATYTLNQKSTFAIGTADEVKELEKRYYSYASPQKTLFSNQGYDPYFTSYVNDASTYSIYTIIFKELAQNNHFNDFVGYDEMVLIAVITGSAAETSLDTILAAFYGDDPEDKSGIALADVDKTLP